jgi:hypothetical protein
MTAGVANERAIRLPLANGNFQVCLASRSPNRTLHVQTGTPFLACVVISFRLGTARLPISLWFKGQRGLSLGNDFNRQRLETAQIATLSQPIAQEAPTGSFPMIV